MADSNRQTGLEEVDRDYVGEEVSGQRVNDDRMMQRVELTLGLPLYGHLEISEVQDA